MKHCLFPVLLLFFAHYSTLGQDNPVLKKVTLRALIILADGRSHKGYIQQVADTALIINTHPLHFGSISSMPATTRTVPYYDITSITVSHKNRVGNGMLIGSLTGLFAGAIVGMIVGNHGDPHPATYGQYSFTWKPMFPSTPAENALAFGITGAIAGAAMGAIIGGLSKKTFIIGGRKKEYDKMRESVLDKAYRRP